MIKFKKVTSIEEEVFPNVCSFADYHSIPHELDDLKKKFQVRGQVIMSREIAFDGDYWGLYWIRGQKPSKEDSKQLLIDNGFDLDKGFSEISL